MASKIVKVSKAEGEALLQMQREREAAMQRQPTRGPEDQNIKTYTRPDQTSPEEEIPESQRERQELNRKLRDMQRKKEEDEEKEPSLRERISEKVKNAKEFVQGTPEEVADRARRKENIKLEDKAEREVQRLEREAKAKKELDKYGGSSSSGGKKKGDDEEDDDKEFEKMLAGMGSGKKGKGSSISGKKPFSEDYKEVYSGKKVMSGDYNEVYKGRLGSDEYTPPKVPKTHAGFLQREDKNYERTNERTVPTQQRAQPTPQQRALPMPMPRVGNFGSGGNVNMPKMSFGGGGSIPKVAMPSTGNHRVGKGGNMPSINISTLGGSTLLPGMGKNSKMGTGTFNIPKIGNWGKAPLKTELNLPNIGNLTIMGAGKQKGGVGISLGGEIPRFGLGTPGKKKK